jgi:hypothetical protein
VERLPIHDVLKMADRGLLPDAKSLAALFLARGLLRSHP